jgi:Ca-activated chloride channel family protein
MKTMDFAQPLWLLVGFSSCIGLTLLFRLMQKRRQTALEKFAAHQLLGRLTRNVSRGRRRYKNILILLSVFMCCTALARPQYGYKWVEVKRKGIDLLFALDSSKSMLAEDIKPNRLKRAHLAILDFVQQLEGDRVGLIPFAGSAYLMCPLTLDYAAFEHSLSAVTTNIIPRGGTNIGSVIEKAIETLNNAANHKILIILTDGENLQGDAVKAAEEAAEQGLTIYTVGVGTSQGELIPLPGGGTSNGFVKDNKGNFVTSRLDEKSLSTIAEKSGGLYFPLGPGGEGLESIYQQKLALIPKEELAERRHKVPLERFEWPLAAALIFLTLELLVGERRPPKTVPFIKRIRTKLSRRNAGTALLLLVALNFSSRAYGSKGEEAFERGDYLQASEYYSQKLKISPDNPELQYNYGTAAYKNNMYDEAIEAFGKALRSDNIELQKKTYYNKGNSHYQKGVEMQQGDPNATIDQWKQALTSLQSAIELAPVDDSDAKYNHEIIKKRLEELEKQQEQQKEENKQDQQQNKNQDDQKQDDSSEQETDQQQSGSEQSQPGPQKEDQVEDQQQQPKDQDESTDTPKAINESPQDADSQEQMEKDAQRQQLGKMTKEEAERMLNALKNEEGELNFVPSGRENIDDAVDRDW